MKKRTIQTGIMSFIGVVGIMNILFGTLAYLNNEPMPKFWISFIIWVLVWFIVESILEYNGVEIFLFN